MQRSLSSVTSAAFRNHPVASIARIINLGSLIAIQMNTWLFHHNKVLQNISLICGVVSVAIWFPASLKYERAARRRGLCGSCGYDLRATPDRCPECGETTKR